MTIPALHVNWTSPYRHGLARAGDRAAGSYRLPAEELLTTVHGALSWRRHHGPVSLVTDSLGAAYAKEQGLASLYDEVDTFLDDLDGVDLDPLVYSTGAKIYAASRLRAPFAIFDTDLYLRRPLEIPEGTGFVFAHWERLNPVIYPDVAEVPNHAGADLSRWTFDTPAANMAISVFLDEEHRAAYAAAGMEYAVGNAGPYEGSAHVRAVFAEQRLAPAVARTLGTDLRPATERFWVGGTDPWDGPDHAGLFHHTWMLKSELRTYSDLRPAYQRLLIEELLWRFPEAEPLLLGMPDLAALAELVRLTAADLRAHGPTTLGALR
ncbi:hypothetical protein LO762_05700 [Actinocorallia sp. API 0066]|uniref:hypothetical protein n=1 Tax=Actinocorallia sp. API 0066 TaxID=2896846 RepID=UPI001E61787C|nr:hypothetical protein [Actinocorallia sp. API 0066]MCD0448691.1 hypothetical protein [Actinocorallia sp. API 0066]